MKNAYQARTPKNRMRVAARSRPPTRRSVRNTFARLSAETGCAANSYGELHTASIARLFARPSGAEARARQTFVDLGSGNGATLMRACHMGGFRRCVGVELSTERHRAARRRLRDLPRGLRSRVQLVHADIGGARAARIIARAHVVYVSNLCFAPETNRAISRGVRAGATLYSSAPIVCKSRCRGGASRVRVQQSWDVDNEHLLRCLVTAPAPAAAPRVNEISSSRARQGAAR